MGMLMLLLPTMVDTMAVTDTVLVDTMAVMLVILIVLTDTDTDTSARGLLMPNPTLMPTMDTTAVDTVMAMDTDMVDTMVDTVDTMAVDTDTVTDTILRLNFCLNSKFLKPYFLSYN